MFSSSRAMSNASFSSRTVAGRNAFRTSGRLIVIFAIPSSVRSYLMSSKSWSVCQVGVIAPSLEELAQSWTERLRLFPRHAMSCIRADPQFGVRQTRDCALRDLDILCIALACDPENRRLDAFELGRRKHGRRILAQLTRELRAVVVFFAPLERVAAEHRLRVPVAHQRRPVIPLESPRPCFIAPAALFVGRVQSGGDDDGFLHRMQLQQLQSEAAAHRVAEEDVAAARAVRPGKKIKMGFETEETGKRPDQAHSSSYLCHTRADAAASGRSSVTLMFHIAAQ